MLLVLQAQSPLHQAAAVRALGLLRRWQVALLLLKVVSVARSPSQVVLVRLEAEI
jgi:hypothetical protein